MRLENLSQLPFECTSQTEQQTYELALQFACLLKAGDCIALQGNLGAGKTVFCRGICRGLGFSGIVNSPSYALVHEYPHTFPIYHMDLYRLPNGSDLEEIGVDYYRFGEGLTLIEWPERLQEHDIVITYTVRLSYADNQRNIGIYQGKCIGYIEW
jgi:tRNA threonylcarbamoyladenosine biosynthesis protein TsaE